MCVVVRLCFVWLFLCVRVCLFKCVCVVVCALPCDVVMCCMVCVWLLFNVSVWFACGFACVVWRVWFCDVVFIVCVASARVVLG